MRPKRPHEHPKGPKHLPEPREHDRPSEPERHREEATHDEIFDAIMDLRERLERIEKRL